MLLKQDHSCGTGGTAGEGEEGRKEEGGSRIGNKKEEIHRQELKCGKICTFFSFTESPLPLQSLCVSPNISTWWSGGKNTACWHIYIVLQCTNLSCVRKEYSQNSAERYKTELYVLLTVKKRQRPCHNNREGKGLLVNREKIRMPEVAAWQQMTQHTLSMTLEEQSCAKKWVTDGKRILLARKARLHDEGASSWLWLWNNVWQKV